jgi:hypothetical protein
MAQKKKQTKSKADGLVEAPMVLFVPTTDRERLARDLVSIARQQVDVSMKFKRSRMEEVQKSLDQYNLKMGRTLKGRWNVPLPFMAGYIDALLSKTDDPPKIKVSHQDLADSRRAAKVQAKWDQDSTAVDNRWAEKDRDMKFLAAFYGVAIGKYFAYNDEDGVYHSHFGYVDPLDFECEPMGGQDLRRHKFKGERNVFKTRSELEAGALKGIYDKKQVLHLISVVGSEEYKKFEKMHEEKTDRMKSLGFDTDSNSYIGVPIFNFTEWYMEDPNSGEWYYILFEPRSQIWVRFECVTDIFEDYGPGDTPYDAWHTHRNPFVFWSKAPADDMRPAGEALGIMFNQMLDARDRNIYAQRGYDPDMVVDPSQLIYTENGLVEIKTDGVKPISSAIYQFKVEGSDEAGTINLMEYIDNVMGLKTGITPSTQGESEDKRVGIYYGNLQQVADRLGLYNKAYSEFYGRTGHKYYLNLKQYVKTNKMMVRMVGLRGYNWEELTKEDLDPTRDFNIEVVGGQAQAQFDEMQKKTKIESLTAAATLGKVNPEVYTEEMLRNGGWEEGQIKRLMDMQSYGSEDMISFAEQAVQDIVYNDKKPKLYRKATFFFMQYILDKADELYDYQGVSLQDYQNLLEYAKLHVQFAAYNSAKNVRMQAALMNPAMAGGGGGLPAPKGATQGATPADAGVVVPPGSPGGTEALGFSDVSMTPEAAMSAGGLI